MTMIRQLENFPETIKKVWRQLHFPRKKLTQAREVSFAMMNPVRLSVLSLPIPLRVLFSAYPYMISKVMQH